jgi:hypothetical protein
MAKRKGGKPPEPPPKRKRPSKAEIELEKENERLREELKKARSESVVLRRARKALRDRIAAQKEARLSQDILRDEQPNQPLNRLRSGEWKSDGRARMVFAKMTDAYHAPGLRELNLVSRIEIKGETYYPPASVIRDGYSQLVRWFAHRNITLDDLDIEKAIWTVEGYSGTQSPGRRKG